VEHGARAAWARCGRPNGGADRHRAYPWRPCNSQSGPRDGGGPLITEISIEMPWRPHPRATAARADGAGMERRRDAPPKASSRVSRVFPRVASRRRKLFSLEELREMLDRVAAG